MSNKHKEVALKEIVLSMVKVRMNLEHSMTSESVTANTEAMRNLADAFAKVAESGQENG